MKLAKFFRKLIQLGVTLLSATLLTQDLTYAQRLDRRPGNDSLFSSNKCKSTGGYFYPANNLVTIQRQTFNSIFYLVAYQDSPAFLSCLVSGNKSPNKTLILKFGIEDGEGGYVNGSYQVIFYLDGQMQGRTSIVRGTLNTVVLDISKTRSVGIEVNLSGQSSHPSIYFVSDSITISDSRLTEEQNDLSFENPSDSRLDNPDYNSDNNQFSEEPQPSLTLDDAFNVINQGLQIWQRFKN